jgi:flagellar motor switch/type III secretory pathway protein FliN
MSEIERIRPFHSVPLAIRVELSCPPIPLERVLLLEPGSTLVTDRVAGGSMDFRIGGQLAGSGEVVTTDHGFGLRITALGGRL